METIELDKKLSMIYSDLIFRGELIWTKKSLLDFYLILFYLFISIRIQLTHDRGDLLGLGDSKLSR